MVGLSLPSNLKSFQRFDIRIISKDSSYTDKTPFGVPIIIETVNTPLELRILCFDIDKSQPRKAGKPPVKVDFDPIVRNDLVELKVDKVVVSFVEVSEKVYMSQPGLIAIQVQGNDKTRILAEIQRNRAIINGRRDALQWYVNNSFQNDLKENIQPIPAVQSRRLDGVLNVLLGGLDFGTGLNRGLTQCAIDFDTIGTENKIVIIFKPKSNTIRKCWVSLHDRGTAGLDAAGLNVNPYFGQFEINFQGVTELDGATYPEELIPDGTKLTKRSGLDAVYRIDNDQKETWVGVTAPSTITSGFVSGSDMKWEVTGGGGSSDLDFIVTIPANKRAWGAGKFPRLFFDGTNAITMRTQYPGGTVTNDAGRVAGNIISKTGWIGIGLRFQQTDTDGEFAVLVGGIVIAKILFQSGALLIQSGDGSTSFVSAYGTYTFPGPGTVYYFFFNIRPSEFNFDFWFNEQFGEPSQSGPIDVIDDIVVENAPFLNQSSFSSIPDRITEIQLTFNSGSSGSIEMGYVSLNEAGWRFMRHPSWTLFDLSDDPVDVEPGIWTAIEIRLGTDTARGNTDGGLVGVVLDGGGANLSDSRALFSVDGGTTWSKITLNGTTDNGLPVPYLLEYGNSWVEAQESEDFVVDYPAKKIDWKGGTNVNAVLRSTRLSADSNPIRFLRGVQPIKIIKASEYTNPLTGGIIQSANKMRVSDIIEHLLEDLTADIPVVDASDFNSAAFERGVFIMRQISILIGIRDLASQYNAQFSLNANAAPTFIFEATKDIVDFGITPGLHEYIVTKDRALLPSNPEAAIIRSHNIGLVSSEVFNRFRVKGKDERTQVVRTNWALVATLGRVIERKPEVFNQETQEENLQRFADAQIDVFGIQVVEGEITVNGMFPKLNGRLDINSIIRVLDENLENGTDITGTANVFKIHRLEFNGGRNETKILVSNRNVHVPSVKRLEELRQVLGGIQRGDPRSEINETALASGLFDASGNQKLFMGLRALGDEVQTEGYIRSLAAFRLQPDGIGGYASFFEPGWQIPNDQQPVDEVVLFEDQRQTSSIQVTTVADSTNYDITINGVLHRIDSGGGATANSIMLQLVDEVDIGGSAGSDLEAGSEPVFGRDTDPTNPSNDTLEVISSGPKKYTISVSGNLTLTVEPTLGLKSLTLTDQSAKLYKWDVSKLHFTFDVTNGIP